MVVRWCWCWCVVAVGVCIVVDIGVVVMVHMRMEGEAWCAHLLTYICAETEPSQYGCLSCKVK
eukprot:scaffold13619_cov24-Tisochrysis_lutea.AAC.1